MYLEADNPLLCYRGAVSLQRTVHGIAPWRVPHEESRLYLPRGGVGRLAWPTGVRACLRTDATSLRCDYYIQPTVTGPKERIPAKDDSPVVELKHRLDVRCDGVLRETIELSETGGSAEIVNLPPGEKEIALWFPHLCQFQLTGISLPPGSRVTPVTDVGRRWLLYGGSVCQGFGAASPSTTWCAQLSARLNLDLTSLSIGAGANLQPMFARLMRSLPADLITCMVGTNDVYVGGFHNFPANLIGFIKIIREGHPTTPLVVLSPTLIPYWEKPPKPDAESLPPYREQAKEVVELLRSHGDRQLYYVSGLDVFGEFRQDYFQEQGFFAAHPSEYGHTVLADNMQPLLAPLLEGDHSGAATAV